MKVFLLAVLVTMTGLFTACSSDDAVTDTTENERGVVKAEFTISFPQKVGTTRMSAATVQEGTAFRGIRNIELYPFVNMAASAVGGSATIPSMISLLAGTSLGKTGASSTTNPNEIASSGALFTTSNSHLYQNVDIPLHTQSFMFYGEAIPSGTDAAVNGALTKSLASSGTTLNDITFNLQQICPNSALGDNATAIATYITSIANAAGWSTSTNVALRSLYLSFTSMKAGSWASIKGAVQKLYTELANNTDAVSTAIRTAINNSTYVTSISGNVITFKELGNYPADINLPDGAAYLAWQLKENSTTEYEFVELANNDNSGMNVAAVTAYAYPASLRYFVLSDIVTSDQSLASLYVDGKSWKTDIIEAKDNQQNLFYNKTKVESTTRSIAIKNQVQYAVGRLDVTVQANGSTLKDYGNNNVTIGNQTFPLTGVLVGGQKPVDYKFEQTTGDTYTIYDKNIASTIYLPVGNKSNSTYTLVLETKEATAAGQTDAVVKIALEFQNNSNSSIIGYNGQVIYPGAKFYLIGMLDPYLNTTQKYSGTETLIRKAFVQDYNTTANILVKSFAQAYNVLPDLTLPTLEMGLSIDLGWKQGITQDINIE
ncbi:MAG: hypothetical protein IJS95_05710 [Prevotella sp.]|nr:hypothetical protein [Prevotella sp.]